MITGSVDAEYPFLSEVCMILLMLRRCMPPSWSA